MILRKKSLASILGQFKKTIAELDAHVAQHHKAVGSKLDMQRALDKEHDRLSDEIDAHNADTAAALSARNKIAALIEA